MSWAISLQCAQNTHQCLQLFACSFFPKQLKAAMPSFRQTGSARNNTPGSHLPHPPPHTWRNSEAFIVCQHALRGIKFQVPTVWFASLPFLAAVPFSHFHFPLQVFSAPPKYITCTKFLDSGRSYEDLNQDKGFPGGSVVKNPPAIAGDVGLIPGSGRFLGEGNGNPLQYSGLGNPMDRGAWQAPFHSVIKELDTT